MNPTEKKICDSLLFRVEKFACDESATCCATAEAIENYRRFLVAVELRKAIENEKKTATEL